MSSAKTPPVFTLLDIGRSLQRMVYKHYNKHYWIKTEIAKMNVYTKSGHCYPDLVEKENGQILAQMRATIWADTFKKITKQFEDITRKPISEGMTVLVLAKVNYHPNYGFSLNIIDIDASFTLGEMAKEKAESLKRLKAEGIFDLNRALTFPKLPQRVAVISVETSKGYQDFINVIQQSYGYLNFKLELFPALLQGDKAISSIAKALEKIEHRLKDFDVVTIIRGGGGDVGLSCYDSFILASKVARFRLPVISGIGHSTNETLVEMVTYANKITPTDVAYFLITSFQEQLTILENLSTVFRNLILSKLRDEQQDLKATHQGFKTEVNALLQSHNYHLREHRQRLKSALPNRFKTKDEELNRLAYELKLLTRQKLQGQHQEVFDAFKTLNKEALSQLEKNKQHLEHLATTTQLLSPQRLLRRGYTMNVVNNKIIKSSTQLKPGDRLKTIFADGFAESDVVKTQQNENK
jgi:exodeoxyribonuclease VII large subunit